MHRLTALLAAALLIAGCRPPAAVPAVAGNGPPKAPPLPKPARVEPGVVVHNVLVPHQEGSTRVWIYRPENAGKRKIPLVLIAPAGSRGFHGMKLGEGDMPEHLPFVRAGMAVAAYELWGHVESEEPTDSEMTTAATAFRLAGGGLVNARSALNYTLARVPNIDRGRIFTSGHSSAGTVSLYVAAREPRVRACVSFAPSTDVPSRLAPAFPLLDQLMPGYSGFIRETSPHQNTATLRCPVFLFHAEDDGNVPISESERFASLLSRTNARLSFRRVPTGGHYDSMIRQGIPMAIRWLKSL